MPRWSRRRPRRAVRGAPKGARPWLRAEALALALAVAPASGAVGACGACDDNAQATATGQAAETSAIASAEDELLARRDAILNSRRRLRERRQELARQRQEMAARGDDMTVIEQKADELAKAEQALATEEDALLDKLEEVITSRQEQLTEAIAAAGSSEAQIASREATMAGRERQLARRESRLADRESQLAERERQLAVRERETCGAAQPTTIVRTVDAKGSKYTRRDVDGTLRRARAKMSRKGILPSDLPAEAQSLQRSATRAMAKGDYGTARFAAAQLVSTVDAVRIDRDFVKGKFRRLNQSAKGVKLDGAAQREFDALLREATTAFGDGKLARANKQLNQIYNLIAGKN